MNFNLSFVSQKKNSPSAYYSHLFFWTEKKYFDSLAIMSLYE